MTYLGYYDPDRKRTPSQKLENAIERYRAKFGEEPDTVLVSPREGLALAGTAIDGLIIHARGYIAPDMFYVGKGGQP